MQQEFLPEVESRTQGSTPRPRTQKNFEAKDRPSRGQGQRPRTQTQVLSKKKGSSKFFFRRKRSLKIFFQVISTRGNQKKGLCRFSARFLAFSNEMSTVQKYCCPGAEDRAIFEDLRLRGQGQELQNVSSRIPPLVFTYRHSIKICASLFILYPPNTRM